MNLDLIRWLNYGHKNTAKKLSIVTNANYLSKMATGDMEIGDQEARTIEKTLTLPVGWLDRDNIAMLNLSATEFELHQLVIHLPNESRVALLGFLSSLPKIAQPGSQSDAAR